MKRVNIKNYQTRRRFVDGGRCYDMTTALLDIQQILQLDLTHMFFMFLFHTWLLVDMRTQVLKPETTYDVSQFFLEFGRLR